jgi:membrane-associated protein
MAELFEYLKLMVNPEAAIVYGGLLLIFAIVFAENGLFVAVFLPGESLVFLSGVFCKMGVLPHSLAAVVATCFGAAWLGNEFGYWFGRRAGQMLFRRGDSWFFKRRHLALARAYHRKYGWKTLLIGRFIPVVRTFAPILAGAIGLPAGRFRAYNLLGSTLYAGPFVALGYFAGAVIPDPGRFVPYMFIGLALIVLAPIVKPLYQKVRTLWA